MTSFLPGRRKVDLPGEGLCSYDKRRELVHRETSVVLAGRRPVSYILRPRRGQARLAVHSLGSRQGVE